MLDQDGTLTRIDPTTNRVSGRFATGALETFLLAAGAGYEWICECAGNHDLMRFDPSTRVAKRFRLPQMPLSWRTSAVIPRTFLVGVDPHTRLLWILGALAATLVPWDTEAGQQAAPSIGLDGRPIQAALARGRIWIAAGTVVDRVWLATGKRDTIAVPRGMNASGVAVDPLTDIVWVANSTTLGPT